MGEIKMKKYSILDSVKYVKKAIATTILGTFLTAGIAAPALAKDFRETLRGQPLKYQTLEEYQKKCGLFKQDDTGEYTIPVPFSNEGEKLYMPAEDVIKLKNAGRIDDNLINVCNLDPYILGKKAYILDAKAIEKPDGNVYVAEYSTTSVYDLGIEGLGGSYAAALYQLGEISEEVAQITGIDKLYHPPINEDALLLDFVDYLKTETTYADPSIPNDLVPKRFNTPAELYREKLFALTSLLNDATGFHGFDLNRFYETKDGTREPFVKDKDGNGTLEPEEISNDDLAMILYHMTNETQPNSIYYFRLEDAVRTDDTEIGLADRTGLTNGGWINTPEGVIYVRGLKSSTGDIVQNTGAPTLQAMVDQNGRYFNQNNRDQVDLPLWDAMFDNYFYFDMWLFGDKLGGRKIIGELIATNNDLNKAHKKIDNLENELNTANTTIEDVKKALADKQASLNNVQVKYEKIKKRQWLERGGIALIFYLLGKESGEETIIQGSQGSVAPPSMAGVEIEEFNCLSDGTCSAGIEDKLP